MPAVDTKSPVRPRVSPLGSSDATLATWSASALQGLLGRYQSRRLTWSDSESTTDHRQDLQTLGAKLGRVCVSVAMRKCPAGGHEKSPLSCSNRPVQLRRTTFLRMVRLRPQGDRHA